MHSLAERVLAHIRQQELLGAGDRVGVAVSGGIDSVALLRLLLELRRELGIVLSVVHFNHKLRGAESDGDEQFVAGLAREYGLQFHSAMEDVATHAREERVSVETAARELRYGFFRRLIGQGPANSPCLAKAARPFDKLGAGYGAPQVGLEEQVKTPTPPLDKIVTGHTLDDQAETVLMRMIRGSGMRGLGGIYPRIPVEDDDGDLCGEIVRPLLGIRRRELEQYLRDIKQPWREDSSNADEALTRNRVRKILVPMLEREFNPAVAENLAELAEIARGEEDYWENEVAGWMGTGVHWSEPEWAGQARSNEELVQIGGVTGPQGLKPHVPKNPSLRGPEGPLFHGAPIVRGNGPERSRDAQWLDLNAKVDRLWFLGEPVAVQRRLVKAIGEHAEIPLEFKHVEEIVRFAAEAGPSGKELSLPLGWKVRREPEELIFVTPDLREHVSPQDYEYDLPIPGRMVVSEVGATIEVQRISADAAAGYNPDQLLDAESLPGPLRVRNWRPGDRFWPAHTKSPRKIKELLQERHVTQAERKLWPVVVSGDEIAWMRGFPAPAKFRARPGREAILIAEKPFAKKA